MFNSCANAANEVKPKIKLEISLKGSYNFNRDFNEDYFLVEAKILNEEDTTISFWGFTCSFIFNFNTDPPEFEIVGNNCNNNKLILYKIKSKQVIITHLIIKLKPAFASSDHKLRLGFVFVDNKHYNINLNYEDFTYNIRKKTDQLIWSNTIFLAEGSGQPISMPNEHSLSPR